MSKEILRYRAQKMCESDFGASYEARALEKAFKFNFEALFEDETVVVNFGGERNVAEAIVYIRQSAESNHDNKAKMRRISSFLYEYMSSLGWGAFYFVDRVKEEVSTELSDSSDNECSGEDGS